MKVAVVWTIGLILLGCYQVVPQSARGHGGAWIMELLAVRVGPAAFPLPGGTVFTAGDGNTLLWFYLRATNETAQDRRFGWKRCVLSRLEGVYVPGLVTRNSDINQLVDDVEVIRAGASVERRIGFAYPKGQKPSELVCAKVTLPARL